MSKTQLFEISEHLIFAEKLADAAAKETLPLFRQPLTIEVKSDKSPLTIADRKAEKAMRKLIHAHYPQHGIVGEELGGNDVDADFVWVLDPIDGTRSFISGSRQYATLIALLHLGAPVIGVLDFPALGERFTGVCANEQRSVCFNLASCTAATAVPPLAQAIAATTSVAVQPGSEDKQLQKFLSACGQVRLGGDAYCYASVAAGFSHLAIDYCMQPYDYLPLLPVVAAAGGAISDWQGEALAPFNAGADNGGRTVLAAANEVLHRQALEAIQGAALT